MFELLLEENMITSIYNVCKNNKERCDYTCGQKFMNDHFLQPKLNVCRANCDVIWEAQYIRQMQSFMSQNSQDINAELMSDLRNRLDVAKKRLVMAKQRLLKTKLALRKALYGRRADMSMKLTQPGPAFQG